MLDFLFFPWEFEGENVLRLLLYEYINSVPSFLINHNSKDVSPIEEGYSWCKAGSGGCNSCWKDVEKDDVPTCSTVFQDSVIT